MNISTSLICCNMSAVANDTDVIIKHPGFNWLHADFMDGHFVPRYGISPELIQSLRVRYGDKVVIDSHLMVEDPYSFAPVIAPYSDWFFFHYEAVKDPMRTLQMLRKKYKHLKIGLSFNILTPYETIETVVRLAYSLGYLDGIMFMGISPGVLGTDSFSDEVKNRISRFRLHNTTVPVKIFIDGSVNFKTVNDYAKLGADVCVSGSSMMFKDNGLGDRTNLIEYNINKINECINNE